MPLEFNKDAICLSGLTGSRLKCDVIGQYYPFWWNITSGGPRNNYRWPTSIVELDAATGEVYIEDINQIILGSSGHALELKSTNPNTSNLKIVLVEKDVDCYGHLKEVIKRRWSNIDSRYSEGIKRYSPSSVFLLNMGLDEALKSIDKISLGNALFFFDPLRSVDYSTIEKVASNRIKNYYRTGTEFIIFIFTSDWFLGRNDFVGLPTTNNPNSWSPEQYKSVLEADKLFGNESWRAYILNNLPIDERENQLINLYKNRLHKWFRYVLPMPFNPKANQIFHLILCSNFETGVKATKKFYCERTGNIEYSPDNSRAFARFKSIHPVIFQGLTRNRRPIQWKILWSIITQHEEGICDYLCSDIENIDQNNRNIQQSLEWLKSEGYLKSIKFIPAWDIQIPQYQLNWNIIRERLGVSPPSPLKPLSFKTLSIREINK